jgi:hypothetical protein
MDPYLEFTLLPQVVSCKFKSLRYSMSEQYVKLGHGGQEHIFLFLARGSAGYEVHRRA